MPTMSSFDCAPAYHRRQICWSWLKSQSQFSGAHCIHSITSLIVSVPARGCTCIVFLIYAQSSRFSLGSLVSSCLLNCDVFGSSADRQSHISSSTSIVYMKRLDSDDSLVAVKLQRFDLSGKVLYKKKIILSLLLFLDKPKSVPRPQKTASPNWKISWNNPTKNYAQRNAMVHRSSQMRRHLKTDRNKTLWTAKIHQQRNQWTKRNRPRLNPLQRKPGVNPPRPHRLILLLQQWLVERLLFKEGPRHPVHLEAGRLLCKDDHHHRAPSGQGLALERHIGQRRANNLI